MAMFKKKHQNSVNAAWLALSAAGGMLIGYAAKRFSPEIKDVVDDAKSFLDK